MKKHSEIWTDLFIVLEGCDYYLASFRSFKKMLKFTRKLVTLLELKAVESDVINFSNHYSGTFNEAANDYVFWLTSSTQYHD